MNYFPLHISVVFISVVFIAVWLLFKASNYSKWVLVLTLLWLTIQAFITFSGFYLKTNVLPPRFLLLIGPPLVFIVLMFCTPKGRKWIDRFNVKTLTWIHILRIPVEVTLFCLFIEKMIPELMTFEGRNFDIISGITAPLMIVLLQSKWKPAKKIFLVWNLICLGLLINIVTIAILAAPFPFQQLAFDQPNVGVFYFPLTWLPGFIVPLVLFSHLVSIRHIKLL